MSALDRVQSFLKSRAGRTALTLVPLAAAVAVSAQAVPIISFANSGSARFISSDGMTLTLPYTVNPATQALSMWEGVTGIKGWLAVGTAPVGAEAYRSVSFLMEGVVSGGPFRAGQTVPLNWNFTLGTTDTAHRVNYRILLTLHNGTNYVDVYDSSIKETAFGGGVVSGHAHTNDLGGFSPAAEPFWSLLLQTYINDMTGGTTLSLDIPSTSVDINADSAIPEPGTWFLMAGGTALLLVGRRLRKR